MQAHAGTCQGAGQACSCSSSHVHHSHPMLRKGITPAVCGPAPAAPAPAAVTRHWGTPHEHHLHTLPLHVLQATKQQHAASASRLTRSSKQQSGRGAQLSGRGAPSKPRRPQQGSKEEEGETEVEVPEVGWLWAAGSSQQREAAGAGAGSAQQPSAQATVADLRKDRISAKKSLGQNFLTDDSILRDIVAAAGVQPGDLVLEVGPGTGNLTKHLLAAGALVTAVEKDDTLYARLAEQYAQVSSLELVHSDVLAIKPQELLTRIINRGQGGGGDMPQDVSTQGAAQGLEASSSGAPAPASSSSSSSSSSRALLFDTTRSSSGSSGGSSSSAVSAEAVGPPSRVPSRPVQKVKVVANLPYNITTDFLKAMLPQGDLVSELHIMLQDEAAVRLVRSAPGDRDYRAMSVRVALYAQAKYRFRIPKAKYYPEPGVDGALVTFALTPPMAPRRAGLGLPGSGERGLLGCVEAGFSQRRKMLRNSLQPRYSTEQVEGALAEVGLPATARAQDLSLTQWAALYKALHARVVRDVVPADVATSAP